MIDSDSNLPAMKTAISEFCQEFSEALSPLHSQLGASIQAVQNLEDAALLQRPLLNLSDIHHRLDSLTRKVAEQQAYVIIFGPLKSGKSTLMNAISASYVSQVTSLPAYPCIVHVKHGEESGYEVTRYNGEKTSYPDNSSLQDSIRQNYEMLAEKIREVEDQGEEFEPAVHYPEAIRRVDVEVAAPNLKDSLAVLVDTPGLYTRMKFGYDLMTREFRSSAASAVFVVKTDNLFFEQVFDEFNELLNLFSRIFLVVNIDSTKQDLGPDGSYLPSLESQSPEEVIKAFEALAMRAPLRKAAEEGRLRIYPVDLLTAASSILQSDHGTEGTEQVVEADDVEAAPDPAGVARKDATQAKSSFSALLRDLTDYLNSSDYLSEFMGDSLHQGETLAGEIIESCSDAALADFVGRLRALRGEAAEVGEQVDALRQCDGFDWNAAFDPMRTSIMESAQVAAEEMHTSAIAEARAAIAAWFEADSSAAALNGELNSLLTETEKQIGEGARSRLLSQVQTETGGMELDALQGHLPRIDSYLKAAVEKGRTALGSDGEVVPACGVTVEESWFKVKKGFWDWVLFRSQAVMRKRLFGGGNGMDREVPAAIKSKRLGEEGRQWLTGRIEAHLESIFTIAPTTAMERLTKRYTDTVVKELARVIEEGRATETRRHETLERQIAENQDVRSRLEGLRGTSVTLRECVLSLRTEYGASTWKADSVEPTEIAEASKLSGEDAPEEGDSVDPTELSDDDFEGF